MRACSANEPEVWRQWALQQLGSIAKQSQWYCSLQWYGGVDIFSVFQDAIGTVAGSCFIAKAPSLGFLRLPEASIYELMNQFERKACDFRVGCHSQMCGGGPSHELRIFSVRVCVCVYIYTRKPQSHNFRRGCAPSHKLQHFPCKTLAVADEQLTT